MFRIIRKMFIVLLTSTINASYHTKCVYLSNQKLRIQPTLINLHHNKYSQELHYYPSAIKLDKFLGGCNTLNDLSNKVYVLYKTDDLNIYVFNMITGKNANVNVNLMEENVSQIKSGIMRNVNVSIECEKAYIWNSATCSCENGNYLASITADLVSTFDEFAEETKTVPTNFNAKNVDYKTQNLHILRAFL